MRYVMSVTYKNQMKAKKKQSEERRKRRLPPLPKEATLIPIHKTRWREAEAQQEVKQRAKKKWEERKTKERETNSERSQRFNADLATYKAVAERENLTGRRRHAVRTCVTCGYPGHKTKRNTRRCPFAEKYTGRLPKRMHRKSVDAKADAQRFILNEILPYMRKRTGREKNPKDPRRTCKW